MEPIIRIKADADKCKKEEEERPTQSHGVRVYTKQVDIGGYPVFRSQTGIPVSQSRDEDDEPISQMKDTLVFVKRVENNIPQALKAQKKCGRPSFPPKKEEYEERGIKKVGVKVNVYFTMVEALRQTLFIQEKDADNMRTKLCDILQDTNYSKVYIVKADEKNFSLKNGVPRCNNLLYSIKSDGDAFIKITDHLTQKVLKVPILEFSKEKRGIAPWMISVVSSEAKVLVPWRIEDNTAEALRAVGVIEK